MTWMTFIDNDRLGLRYEYINKKKCYKRKNKGSERKNLSLTIFVSMLSLVSNHPHKSVAIRYEGDTAATLRTLIV